MTLTLLIASFLHLLVLVYWLGGDLGAFYASRFVSAPETPPPARALGAKILMGVDMAPRTAMLLALPTGVALAMVKGWFPAHFLSLLMLSLFFLCWLALVWAIHGKKGNTPLFTKVDTWLRWAFLISLLLASIAGLTALWTMPLFIAVKLGLLALTVLLGLFIRWRLKPFGPAFARMMQQGPSEETDRIIKSSISGAKPFVLMIWMCLVIATLLGIATPV